MRKKAVLIGINYPGTTAELHGCVNDVHRMHKCLIDRYGFLKEDIKVLIDTDESYIQPTGKNIREVLLELVSSAKSGDVLVVHYSGHGTRVPLKTGESDYTGFDECIVPSDFNLIPDDDFRKLVVHVPEGCKITIISDSCHSGGLIDEAKEQIGESTTKKPNQEIEETFPIFHLGNLLHNILVTFLAFCGIGRSCGLKQMREIETREIIKGRYMPVDIFINLLKEQTGKNKIEIEEIRPTIVDVFGEESSPKVKSLVQTDVEGTSKVSVPERGILLSGCQTDQTSADVSEDEEAYGAFSNAIQVVLSEIGVSEQITNKELVLRTREILKKQGFDQRPGLYCHDRFLNASFIS